jgi:hypothetical protein
MIAREIIEPLYRVKVFLLAKCTAEEANKKILKCLGYEAGLYEKDSGTLIQFKDGKHFIMWLRKTDNNTIGHECSHLIDDIYAYRGITHNCACGACSEHRAYQSNGWVDIIKAALK